MADKNRKLSGKRPEKKPEKRSRIDRVVSEVFQESVREIRKMEKKSTAPKMYDLTGDVLRRRKEVTSAYLEQARSRWAEKYQELNVDEEWARACSSIGHTAGGLDGFYHTSLAAALWILDALEESGSLREAAQYLPREKESFTFLPDFFVPRYGDDTIRRAVRLLRQTDERESGFASCINPVTAARREPVQWRKPEGNPEELDNAGRLGGILALIHPALIERAARRFEEKLWDFMDRYFSCIARYAKEERLHSKKCEQLFDQCQELGKSLGFPFWEDEENRAGPSPVPPLALADPLQAPLLPPIYSDKVRRGEVKHLETIVKAGAAEEEAAEKCENLRLNLAKSAGLMFLLEGTPLAEWRERYGPETAGLLEEFSVDDPYEICFAFVYLVESGYDLPWLYTPAIAVLLAAVARLPWTADDGEGFLDEEDWDDWDDWEEEPESAGETEEETEEEGQALVPPDRTPQRAPLYALNYTPEAVFLPDEEIPSPARRRNLPQLVYAMTGLVMPRNVPEEREEDLQALAASGIPVQELPLWGHYLQLAGDAQNLDDILLGDQILELSERAAAEPLEEDETNAPRDSGTLEKRIQELEAQLSRLRGELYESSREAARSRSEIERVRTETANEHQELLDLRELVFNLETGAEPDLKPRRTIQFPFEVHRRTVVFGGHDTWLKAIRPMLPNVNFVGREVNPSADMIRHADVVWIQANALAHKRYYKIIDIVRINHIPVRYFGCASAEKCALQLAAADDETPVRSR